MIAFLRGRLLRKAPGRLVVDVQGVGYDVHVPLSSYYETGEPGAEVALRIHTHVREDTLQLYGFVTELEQDVFGHLITITGIGPKLAVSVLSGIEPRDLVSAVQRGDVARLTRVPGIGRKTAERMVLELKDRLDSVGVPMADAAGAPIEGDRLRDDMLSALQNLGYHRPLAEKAVEAVLSSGGPPLSLEQALRGALRELMRG
jgi:Holliday junction DNA helicase RuvA